MLFNLQEYCLYNQALYRPQGNYVKIIELNGEQATVQGVMHSYYCTLNKLNPIPFNNNMPTLLGMSPLNNWYVKDFPSDDRLAMHFDEAGNVRIWWNEEEKVQLRYLHEVQNAYYQLTGEICNPNIYGVKG